jgi:hypothetical protein
MQTSTLALAAALLAAPLAASAATIPFTNDFSSSGFATQVGFSGPASGALTLSASGTSPVIGYGTEQFTNSPGATFSVSTTFNVSSFGNARGDTTIGFVLFANNSGEPGTAGTNYLLADFTFLTGTSADGRLRFLSFTGTSNTAVGDNAVADANTGNANRAILADTTYTLRVDITHTGANTYDLSLGLFDASGLNQIGSSAVLSDFISTGEFFGVRSRINRDNGSTGTTTINVESFSAAVIPEPSAAAALLGLGALGFAALRRRR